MKYHDFASKFPIKKCENNDFKMYEQFMNKNFMQTSKLCINIVREQNIVESFDMQGMSAHPYFIVDNNNFPCGFFAISKKKAWLKNSEVEIAYSSDLRIDTTHSRTGLRIFRAMYSDFLTSYKNIQEFQNCSTLLTSVLDENIPALRALTRKRNEIIYKPIQSYATWSHLIHPGFKIFELKNKMFKNYNYKSIKSSLSDNSIGLHDHPDTLANAQDICFEIELKGKRILTGSLCLNSLRNIHISWGPFSRYITKRLPARWITQFKVESSASQNTVSEAFSFLVCNLLNSKLIKYGDIVLLKEPPSGIAPQSLVCKRVPGTIFEVCLTNQDTLFENSKLPINLEPAFL